jgi:hypothetical protein
MQEIRNITDTIETNESNVIYKTSQRHHTIPHLNIQEIRNITDTIETQKESHVIYTRDTQK